MGKSHKNNLLQNVTFKYHIFEQKCSCKYKDKLDKSFIDIMSHPRMITNSQEHFYPKEYIFVLFFLHLKIWINFINNFCPFLNGYLLFYMGFAILNIRFLYN